MKSMRPEIEYIDCDGTRYLSMNKPKYEASDRSCELDFNCPCCDGWGSFTDDRDEVCDCCFGAVE